MIDPEASLWTDLWMIERRRNTHSLFISAAKTKHFWNTLDDRYVKRHYINSTYHTEDEKWYVRSFSHLTVDGADRTEEDFNQLTLK